MQIARATPLLGGLSPSQFMRRHWQKKPLLIRQAVAGGLPGIGRAALFELASRADVESRLIVRDLDTPGRWTLRHGPLNRRALPALARPGWTLLVQGVDSHLAAAHDLLSRFRFVPEARLDDLMVSYATEGGGVGPHVDSYDVFLLQAQGRRRWRIGKIAHPRLLPDVPLKILSNFVADQEWLLEPGDMLYLPPNWAHEGTAAGECITCSVGFRAVGRDEIGREVMQRMLDAALPVDADSLYGDPGQAATEQPGRIPDALAAFALKSMQGSLDDQRSVACALGEVLSDLKSNVCFDPGEALTMSGPLQLDRRTRMLYDLWHVFINGESFRAGGRDATLMHVLADQRVLTQREVARLSTEARALLQQWAGSGWIRAGRVE